MPVIKTQITVRLDPETHAKLKKIAFAETRSVSNMIEFLVVRKIRQFEKDNGEIQLTDEDIYGDEG